MNYQELMKYHDITVFTIYETLNLADPKRFEW